MGNSQGSAQPSTWRVERDVPVRADAPSLFIPRNELPEAHVGDLVTVTGTQHGDERTGSVVELIDDDERGRFVVVDLDETQREDDAIEER